MEEKATVVVYSLIGIITVLLNILEITIIVKGNETLKTYDQLLLSLAISDLLVGFSSVVYSSLVFHLGASKNRQVFTFMVSFTFVASLLNLMLIGLDRLVAVHFPFKHRIWVQQRWVLKAILGIWIFLLVDVVFFATVGIAFPATMDGAKDFYRTVLPVLIIVSSIALTSLYGLICYFFSLTQKNLQHLNPNYGKKASSKKFEVDADTHSTATTASNDVMHLKANPYFIHPEESPSRDLVRASQYETKHDNGHTEIEMETKPSNDATCASWHVGNDNPAFALNEVEKKEKVKMPKGVAKPGKICHFCRKQKALFITCFLVLLSFISCTLPFAVQSYLMEECSLEILLIANSLANPVIYFFKGADYEKFPFVRKKKGIKTARDATECHCH